MIRVLPDKAHIVEVGAWKGRSTAFLAVEIINSGKQIKLDVVDSWTGPAQDPEVYSGDAEFLAHGRNIIELFKKNMSPVEGLIDLTPVQKWSVQAARGYENQSLDFVYIDADHSYDGVVEDLHAWVPKIKQTGVIGGHDYHEGAWPDVTTAVDEAFGKVNVTDTNTWWVKL